MAIEATQIYAENIQGILTETMDLINKGINPIVFPGLETTITSDESKAINFDEALRL